MVRVRAFGYVSRCFGPPTLDRNVKLRKYKHFERWATAKGIAVSRVAWHTVVEVCQQAIVIVVCSTLLGITGRCACFAPGLDLGSGFWVSWQVSQGPAGFISRYGLILNIVVSALEGKFMMLLVVKISHLALGQFAWDQQV